MAEAEIVAAATQLGIPVLKPVAEHSRYDMVFEVGGRLLRVQCKWARRKGDIIEIRLVTNRRGAEGFIRTKYTADEIDAVAVYCKDTDECYLLPVELAGERAAMYLRVSPTKNGQRAALNWASDHTLAGAVAQLEVASGWQPEGRGFESDQLHSDSQAAQVEIQTVGANVFRNHFGHYMELAAAGATIDVTRRGRPYVRLTSAAEPVQLDFDDEAA